jgi:hypothetical protein
MHGGDNSTKAIGIFAIAQRENDGDGNGRGGNDVARGNRNFYTGIVDILLNAKIG